MQAIPLSSLIPSKEYNVRKTDPKKDIASLKASIAAHGLQHNLIVLPVKGTKKYEVVAGNRRYTVLNELVKEGKLPKNFTVPCQITDKAHAKEISLAENVVRSAMHPADEYETWAELVDKEKLTPEQIATRFGTSASIVEQRLKMGRLSPKLMKAYRNEELPLAALMAFTLSDDHAQQEEVYKRFKGSYELGRPDAIRQALTEKLVRCNHRVVKFVGLEAYEAAGGAIRRDLFSDKEDCYLEDAPLLQKLALEKLERIATELQKSWKWAEVRESFGYDDQRKFRQIYEHELGEVPEKLLKKQATLERKLEKLEEAEADESEAAPIQKQLAEVELEIAAYSGWTDEEKAISGCVVTLGWNGEADITCGLVRPEDDTQQPESEEEDEGNASGEDDDDNTGTIRESMRDARTEGKFDYTSALLTDLKSHRLQVMRFYMEDNFEVAFDTALYNMCLRDLNPSYYYGHEFLQVRATKYTISGNNEETTKALAAKAKERFDALPLAWMNHKNELERYEAFCALSMEDKQKLFAACIARALTPQLCSEVSKSGLFDAIGKRLGVDMAAHWRPTKANYFDRITKKQALECAEEVIGAEWAKKHANQKKEDVVLPLDAAFLKPESDQFSPEQQERLKTWLPKGMAF